MAPEAPLVGTPIQAAAAKRAKVMNDKNSMDTKGIIVIGEGVSVVGSFTVPGRASIYGSLQGELDADEVMVGQNGRVVGLLKARHVELLGEARETIVASERLVVKGTGKVDGQITYGEIEVERGAFVKGTLACSRQTAAEAGLGQPPAGPGTSAGSSKVAH